MNIDQELLKKIARNARLDLTEAEMKEFLPQLQQVLNTFSLLDKVDTKDVAPSFHPIAVENVMREDEITKCFSVEETFNGVKNKEKSYFKGPKAI